MAEEAKMTEEELGGPEGPDVELVGVRVDEPDPYGLQMFQVVRELGTSLRLANGHLFKARERISEKLNALYQRQIQAETQIQGITRAVELDAAAILTELKDFQTELLQAYETFYNYEINKSQTRKHPVLDFEERIEVE